MQTKHLFLLPALAFLACAGLRAQVTIGGLTDPAAGAILDLNSDTKGGLILSNVTITDPERIPHGTKVFQGIDAANDHNNTDLRGTMVYNDGQNPALPAGIYIWNGSCWTKNGGEVIINPPAITVDGAVKSTAVATQGSSVGALAVASPQPDVKYEWYKNTTASTTDGTSTGTTGETYSTPDNLTAGTYYYYCKATSLACPSVNAVSGVITATVLDPVIFQSGAGKLGGASCFDVAYSNDGGSCGALSRRASNRRVFSTSPTEIYTFTVTSGSANYLSFDFRNLDAAHPVIQSLSWSTSPDTTVTVTFNAGHDTWAQGLTKAEALKAELYAIYDNNQATMLTLSVSDCLCCPGLLVPGGEYIQYSGYLTPIFDNSDSYSDGSAAKAVMETFTNKTGYDLCYYKRNANSSGSAGSSSIYKWNTTDGTPNAMNVCQTTQGVDAADDPSSGWRLPNLAELAQIGQLVSSYTPSGGLGVGVGSQEHVNAAISGNTGQQNVIFLPVGSNTTTTGTYNLLHTWYWSSTESNGSAAWLWDFHPNYRYAGGNNKSSTTYVRCVKAF